MSYQSSCYQREQEKDEFYHRSYLLYRQSLQKHASKVLHQQKKKFHAKIFEKRFIAFFGVSIHVATEIYIDIKWLKLPMERITHLLWTLHWLKGYPPERQGAPTFQISETTWRVTVKHVTFHVLSKLNQVFFYFFFFR